jgi:hypothetical protein
MSMKFFWFLTCGFFCQSHVYAGKPQGYCEEKDEYLIGLKKECAERGDLLFHNCVVVPGDFLDVAPVVCKIIESFKLSPQLEEVLSDIQFSYRGNVAVLLDEEVPSACYDQCGNAILLNPNWLQSILKRNALGELTWTLVWETLNAAVSNKKIRPLGTFPEVAALFQEAQEYQNTKPVNDLTKEIASKIPQIYSKEELEYLDSLETQSFKEYIQCTQKPNHYDSYPYASHWDRYAGTFSESFNGWKEEFSQNPDVLKNFSYALKNENAQFFWSPQECAAKNIVGYYFAWEAEGVPQPVTVADLNKNEWELMTEAFSCLSLENQKSETSKFNDLNDLENEAIITAEEEAEAFQKIKTFKDFFDNSKK